MKNRISWLLRSKALLAIFIVFTVILLVIAHKLYTDRKNELKVSIQNNLKAIAELKSAEIHTWLNERLSDANVLSHNSLYPEFTVTDYNRTGSLEQLQERLTIFQQHYKYENIILLDINKKAVLFTNDSLMQISEATKQMLNDDLRGKTSFKIYRDDETQRFMLDFYCVILNPQNEKLGYLILRVNPEKYFFPTINRWPVESKSAETVIVERSGDSVRSLNNAKFRANSALKPLIRIDKKDNPGVNAVLGGSRLFEGKDYRQVPVLSYWVPVEATNWKMIAKVDQEEIYEPLRYQALVFGFILSMLLLFVGSVLLLIKNLYQNSYIKSLYDAEVERKLLVSHFEYLIKNANDIILLANDNDVIVEVNDAAVRTYGFSREELIGAPLSKLGEFSLEKKSEKSSDIYETVHYHSDGSPFPVEINEQIIDAEGTKFFQAIIRDISERKKAQTELDKSLLKYKTLFFDSPDGYLIVRDGIFVECNKASEILIGGDRSAIIGKTPVMISPEYQPNGKKTEEYVLEVIDDAFKYGSTSFEWIHSRVDGTEFLAQIHLSAIDYEDHPALFVTWRDITKIREAENQLIKLSRAVEQSPVSVVITNLEGNIEYANPTACLTTGYSLEELLGKNPRVLKSGETIEEEYHKLWDNITKGYQWRGVFHNKRKNGELYWEASTISPIVNSVGKITHYLAIKEDITEKRKAEEELQKFLIISDNANFGNVISDLDGNLLYSNKYFARMHGYEVEEIVGKNLSMLHSEHQMIRVIESIEMLRRDGEFHSQEIWRTRKDGTAFPSMMNAFIIYDKENKPSFMSATVIDVTEQKEAEEALRKSEESLNYAQEIANMGSWSLDLVGQKLKWSRNYYKIMGLDPSTEVEDSDYFQRMVHPDDLHLLDDKLEEIIQTRKPTNVDLRLVMADGSVKWVQNNIVPVFDGDKLIALEGVNIDITEKKIKDAEISKLSQAVEQSPILVVITDLSGSIIYVNPAFEETTGYSRQEVMGKNPRILNSGQQEISFFKNLWETIAAGQEWKGELLNKKKNGELYWENMSVTPIHDSTGKITNYLAIKQDITQSKENEQKILDLNASLERKIEERTAQLSVTNKELAQEIQERISIEEELIKKSNELESFFSVSLDLLCIANTSGQFLKVNKAWESILGYSTAELENSLFLDFVHPDDIQETLNVMGQLSEQNPIINFVNRYKTKDGSYRFIEWHSAPAGEMIYAAARDITNRKRKEDFEMELLKLSMQLTGIRAEEIEQAIGLSLERIGKFTDSDRTFIFEIDPGGETFSNSYEWIKDQTTAHLSSERNIPMDMLPMWWDHLRQGKPVVINDFNDLPESWSKEKSTLEPFGDKSILVIPMFSENNLIGYGGLATINKKKQFSNEEINLLTIWCSMLTNVINNFHADLLLNQTRKNYETFFNTLEDFLWVLDKDGTIIHFNNTAIRRLGYTLEELVGKSILMIHPEDKQNEAKMQLNSLLTANNEVFSIPLKTKAGQIIPVETKAIRGFWNGQPVIFKASKDISQIKLSEEKFSTAFQSNSAMMAISNFDDGKYLDVNNSFLEVMGYTREEVIGKSGMELGLFLDPDDRKEITDSLNSNQPVRKREVLLRTKTGEVRIGLMSADTINIGNTRCLLTVNIDITDRKKMEEQLKAAQEEAHRANIAKSEFLSRMSHELRTPMNSILGFAQLLDIGELNPGQKKGLKHILNSGKHLLDLINEVLEISRIEAGRLSLSPEPIHVGNIIHEMMEIVWPLAKDKQLMLDLIPSDANQLYILADRQRLKQVLLNLINNAIKYNKEGGSIQISSALMGKNVLESAPIRISIKDTGIGILPEKISHLYNPFERIGAESTTTEGTGLGLAVVKKLIDAMGGAVGVESVAGVGSTFWIELPHTNGQLEHFDKSENYNDFDSSLTNKTGTILYIEDNQSNIELVEQILVSHCNHIRMISNMYGNEAVQMAQEYKPDLILLDLNLPDIHGGEVLDLLRNTPDTSKIPVVVISADATAQQLERLKKKGADDYLTKPLDVKELLKMINSKIRS